MSNIILSPSMNLPVPVVGTDPGPDWATNINNCLALLDQHNHAAGSGVQINPAGLNINSDLPFNNNNLISARSLRFQVQSAALALVSDINCLSDINGDLYFNDGSGNVVRITKNGAVAGTPGSIANLVSPASASYVAGTQTFVFQSAANTPGNLDGGFLNLRNNAANSFALTLLPPSAMGANFQLTLPSLPGSQKIMTLDNTGNMSAPYGVDNSSIEISASNFQVKNGGVTQAKKAIRAISVGGSDPGVGGVSVSASCGNFPATNSNAYVTLTNLSCTLTTLGNPVSIRLVPDGTTGLANTDAGILNWVGGNINANYAVFRDATEVFTYGILSPDATGALPVSSIQALDVNATAGTHTYNVEVRVLSGAGAVGMKYAKLIVYEI